MFSIGILSGSSGFIAATGGSIATDGDYKVHTFTSSGTLQITTGSGDVEYLVVGGGGGGGYNIGGGGGAGRVRSGTLSRSVGSYTVTIGAGGAGIITAGPANAGSSSVFDTITSEGGAGGGSRYWRRFGRWRLWHGKQYHLFRIIGI